MRASLLAMAFLALGAPSLVRKRRYCAPKVDLAAQQRARRVAQGQTRPVLVLALFPADHFAAGDLIIRAEAQMRGERPFRLKTAHIAAHLGEHSLGGQDIDSVDAR